MSPLKFLKLLILFIFLKNINCKIIELITNNRDTEIFDFVADMVKVHYKDNGWNTIITFGQYPNKFYDKLQALGTILTYDSQDNVEMENAQFHYPNSIIMYCTDLEHFESTLSKAEHLSNWHPHTNVYVYHKTKLNDEIVRKIFFALWFKKITNAIIIHYDESSSYFQISEYSPYVSEFFRLQHHFGCYTVKRLGVPLRTSLMDNLNCEENCENVTIISKLRARNLGTCLGINYHCVLIGDLEKVKQLDLFQDKGKNMHGYVLRTYVADIPFMVIQEYSNGSFSLHKRDGLIWETLSTRMNFSMDINAISKDRTFSFDATVKQLIEYSHRRTDLFLLPIYLADLVVIELDYTFPFKQSGVCYVAHRAALESFLFDVKIIEHNYIVLIEFCICFIGIWFTFSMFNLVEKGKFSFDQIGIDFVNSIRTILTISLYRPPKRSSFKIFQTVSIWTFFVINFSMQAAIISLFTTFKRGKEVETFEDMLGKDYPIEGLMSPDVMLPDNEEIFIKINNKLVPIDNMYDCLLHMSNDSQRFCIADCSAARYFERNIFNNKGEQYLHVITDRIHSHYLNYVLPKFGHLGYQIDKVMMALVEAGIIHKWEDYKYADNKVEAVIKPLSMDDVMGIFKCFWLLIAASNIVFGLETICGIIKWFNSAQLFVRLQNWNHNRVANNHMKINSRRKIKSRHNFTQTEC